MDGGAEGRLEKREVLLNRLEKIEKRLEEYERKERGELGERESENRMLVGNGEGVEWKRGCDKVRGKDEEIRNRKGKKKKGIKEKKFNNKRCKGGEGRYRRIEGGSKKYIEGNGCKSKSGEL